MLANVLDRLAGRMTARKRSARETVEQAARRIAAGESVDEAAVLAALVEARLGVDDMARLATLFEGRAERLKTLGGLAAAQKRAEAAQARVDSEEQKHAQAVAAFRQRMATLDDELRQARSAVDTGQAARAWLLSPENCPPSCADDYAAALAAEEAARVAVGDAERLVRATRSKVADARRWIESIERSEGKEIRPSAPTARDQQLSAAAAERVADHERRIRRLTAQLAEAEAAERQAAAALAAATAAVAAAQERVLRA